jgi:ParB family transcriptional regulator, chromosome partitioning protein
MVGSANAPHTPSAMGVHNEADDVSPAHAHAQTQLVSPEVLRVIASKLVEQGLDRTDTRRMLGDVVRAHRLVLTSDDGPQRPEVVSYLEAAEHAVSVLDHSVTVDDALQGAYRQAVQELVASPLLSVPMLERAALRGDAEKVAKLFERFVLGSLEGRTPSAKKLVQTWRRKLEAASNTGTERTRTARRCRAQLAAALSKRIQSNLNNERLGHHEVLPAKAQPRVEDFEDTRTPTLPEMRFISIASLDLDGYEPNPDDLRRLTTSMSDVGQLAPVIVDANGKLISGRGRIAALKALGESKVLARVMVLEGDLAELAMIDENFARKTFTVLELSEPVRHRQEIHERRHPEARHGGASPSNDNHVASAAAESGALLGLSPRSVQELVQIARDIDDEAKALLRGTPVGDAKKQLLRLAREKDKAKQVEVARLIADKKAKTVHAALKALNRDVVTAGDEENTEPEVITIDPSASKDISVIRRGKARVARIRIDEQLIELRIERDTVRWVPVTD